jgi:hypothetical protein
MYLAGMGGKKILCRILTEETEEERPLGRPRDMGKIYYKKFYEELIACFLLLKPRAHRKRKLNGGIHRDTDIHNRQQGDFMSLLSLFNNRELD